MSPTNIYKKMTNTCSPSYALYSNYLSVLETIIALIQTFFTNIEYTCIWQWQCIEEGKLCCLCLCFLMRIGNFSLPGSLFPNLIMLYFRQGKFIRVYSRKRNHDKCRRITYFYSLIRAAERICGARAESFL